MLSPPQEPHPRSRPSAFGRARNENSWTGPCCSLTELRPRTESEDRTLSRPYTAGSTSSPPSVRGCRAVVEDCSLVAVQLAALCRRSALAPTESRPPWPPRSLPAGNFTPPTRPSPPPRFYRMGMGSVEGHIGPQFSRRSSSASH